MAWSLFYYHLQCFMLGFCFLLIYHCTFWKISPDPYNGTLNGPLWSLKLSKQCGSAWFLLTVWARSWPLRATLPGFILDSPLSTPVALDTLPTTTLSFRTLKVANNNSSSLSKVLGSQVPECATQWLIGTSCQRTVPLHWYLPRSMQEKL